MSQTSFQARIYLCHVFHFCLNRINLSSPLANCTVGAVIVKFCGVTGYQEGDMVCTVNASAPMKCTQLNVCPFNNVLRARLRVGDAPPRSP